MKIITLCGSTKFKAEFEAKNKELTLDGNIVISVACFGHSGDPFTNEQKVLLDEIHKRKIDLADAIYVINKNGYIGASTKSEIEYAAANGKEILYMEKPTTYKRLSRRKNEIEYDDPMYRRLQELEDQLEHGELTPTNEALDYANGLKEVIEKQTREETLKEVFNDMYKHVKEEEEHCDVIVKTTDIKAIAKRYGVEVRCED